MQHDPRAGEKRSGEDRSEPVQHQTDRHDLCSDRPKGSRKVVQDESADRSFSDYIVVCDIPPSSDNRQFEKRRGVGHHCNSECEWFRLSESDGESESGNDDFDLSAASPPQVISSAVNANWKVLALWRLFGPRILQPNR